MKTFSILAGVVVASAIAAPAFADPIQYGRRTNDLGVDYTSIKPTDYSAAKNHGHSFSAFAIQGGSAGNNGTASLTDGATFTLKGAVTKDCAYYTGNANTTIDFGTIGIYASDNTGPAAAFDMTAPANVSINTNLAGCNTSNTVSVSKNDIRGLVNNSGVGYDSNVFQASLPYSVSGSYTAGAVGSTAAATSGNWIELGTNANATSATHGAWKSAMSLDVSIPVPAKSLLAGSYEGQLTVSITAF